MCLADYPSSHAQAERAIAAARVALAISSLFAVWLDPAEPERYAQVTYGLYWGYVVYSMLTALVTWQRPQARWLPLTTHVVDIVSFSVFQYLTLGPSSPFFLYFLFSLFCGAIRWGWRGTLATASVVVTAYLVMSSSMSRTLGASEFELNRFVVRVVYLGVAAGLLVYLGRYEARLREEIERLARWPVATEQNGTKGIADVVAHAARILQANRLAITWETSDEPWTNELSWSAEAGVSLTKRPPAED